jgi:2',3'-cyclic-nucleotide 2'-phosphodiesterase (5'-nucleotidase family)
MNQFEIIHFYHKKIIFKNKNNFLKGNIFFTGDLEGFKEECVDCQGNIRFIPKLAHIIKSHDNYLYFDIGDFTPFTRKSNGLIMLEIFNYLGASAINLTKKDYYFLSEKVLNSKKINFVSSNLKLDSEAYKSVSEIAYFPFFKLSNNTSEKKIIIGIIGLSDNRRIPGKWEKKVLIINQEKALKRTIERINKNVDVLILLYHDSLGKLKNLLINYSHKDIDIVIGSYGDFFSKKLFYINDIPVSYIGNRGKVLTNIKIYNYSKDKYFFEYNPIKIWRTLPDDKYILDIINTN